MANPAQMPSANMTPQQTEDNLKQIKEFIGQYNKLSEHCFTDCIHDFTGRKVAKSEENCVLGCMEKYLKATQRISQRFQEYQIALNEGAMAAAEAASGQFKS